MTHKLSKGLIASGRDVFEEFECVISVAIDYVHADGWIDVMRQRIFANQTRADGQNIGRVEFLIERSRLASVDNKQHLVVPAEKKLAINIRCNEIQLLFFNSTAASPTFAG